MPHRWHAVSDGRAIIALFAHLADAERYVMGCCPAPSDGAREK